MNPPLCKKCLMEKLDPHGIYETVRERVKLIPDDERCPDDEYYRRLGICTECARHNSGTCALCGCFVEYRAAFSERHCPDNKW